MKNTLVTISLHTVCCLTVLLAAMAQTGHASTTLLLQPAGDTLFAKLPNLQTIEINHFTPLPAGPSFASGIPIVSSHVETHTSSGTAQSTADIDVYLDGPTLPAGATAAVALHVDQTSDGFHHGTISAFGGGQIDSTTQSNSGTLHFTFLGVPQTFDITLTGTTHILAPNVNLLAVDVWNTGPGNTSSYDLYFFFQNLNPLAPTGTPLLRMTIGETTTLAVPEPGTLALAACGLVTFIVCRSYRRTRSVKR